MMGEYAACHTRRAEQGADPAGIVQHGHHGLGLRRRMGGLCLSNRHNLGFRMQDCDEGVWSKA